MQLGRQLAEQFREVFLDGHWVANTNLKEQVASLDWQQATSQVGDFNTIALLTFHLHYYLAGILQVLEGGSLDIRDRYSFDAPPISSAEDWERLQSQLWNDAARFAQLVEDMTDEELMAEFVDEKYGNFYRNIQGMIEHGYYHLGQIVLIRKLLPSK
jgi:uncharacterized damage-inducible protein DinB